MVLADVIEHGQKYQKAYFGPPHGHWFEIYEKPDEYPVNARVRLLNGVCVVMAHDTKTVSQDGRVKMALIEEDRAAEYDDDNG